MVPHIGIEPTTLKVRISECTHVGQGFNYKVVILILDEPSPKVSSINPDEIISAHQ